MNTCIMCAKVLCKSPCCECMSRTSDCMLSFVMWHITKLRQQLVQCRALKSGSGFPIGLKLFPMFQNWPQNCASCFSRARYLGSVLPKMRFFGIFFSYCTFLTCGDHNLAILGRMRQCPRKTIVLVEFIMFLCKRMVRTLASTEVMKTSWVDTTLPLHTTRPDSMKACIHTKPCFRRPCSVM